ncbi:MAG: hypothetical protein K2Y27_00905 [Xanthobacteraceae bacterium]|nr:hypothetical protein [Xanthobacteraceae bacterium]
MLRCSVKTLAAHVRSGSLKYVIIGHGSKRPRRRFTDTDLSDFVQHQTRRDAGCPSIDRKARRSTTSISSGEAIAFTALRSERAAARQRQ